MTKRMAARHRLGGRGLAVALLLALLASGALSIRAAEPTDAERRAVATANLARGDDPAYAERLYTEFIAQYPESVLLGEALLGKSQALFNQGKFDAALGLLREEMPRAGTMVDQFEFWIGENLIAKGELEQAEAAFGNLIARHPVSTHLLAAAVRQAFTVYQRKDYERAVALLADPAGAFEKARAKEPASAPAINGLLFLAESRFELRRFAEIEPALALLPAEGLPTSAAWRRVALRARVLAATDRAAEALPLMEEVLRWAQASERPDLIAESHALNGSLLEQLGRPAEALVAYEPNLKPEVPAKWRGHALSRIVALAEATGGAGVALQRLELLSAQGLDEPARDLVQLTLGELRLRLFQELPAAERTNAALFSPNASNYVLAALANFTNVITGFSNSPYAGKAWLNRGWCNWHLTQWPEAIEAFGEASQRLPAGLDQARSIFKLADAQFQLGQFEPALTNYVRLVREHGAIPEVKDGLLDQAYYQLIQAAIQTGNQAEAEFAVKALLAQFPGSFYADRGLLQVGQFLNDVRNPARARAVFELFSSRFKDSSLAPERELAIARTYELENNWPEATSIYDRWLSRHTNHAARASAEFHRAFALASAQDLTNAVVGFTNFLASFPQSELAPEAYLWLGKHYDQTQDYELAELNYQRLFSRPYVTNWPVSRLTYDAQIYASRSALERRLYDAARGYLTNLVNTAECPGELRAEAFFALGDVFAADASLEGKVRFGYAVNSFRRLINDYPDSPIVPAAWGRIGESSLQLDAFDDAASAFTACLEHPLATIAERSRAEVGLGLTLENKAKTLPPAEQPAALDAARDHYLNVFYQRNLKPESGDVADPLWLQRACDRAARLAASRGDWNTAARLYERLKELLPVLKDYCDPLIRQMDERGRQGG